MSSAPAGDAPLSGIRILDLTRLLPGGYCTLLFVDLGADVIKVEEPGRGDSIRWSPPLVDGVSAAHRALNRGKRSVTLDLKAELGTEVLLQLAANADVLIEGFRPGVMDRLGVGHERLRQANPRLVTCAITGYGQEGPYRDAVGHDINYLGYAGALWLSGATGSEPQVPGIQAGDLGGGAMMAAVGILAALLERERTGLGRFVDVSMLDGVISWMSIHLGAHLADPSTPRSARPLSGDLACYRIYRCAGGGTLTVGALEPQFWRTLCETLGLDQLIDEQYAPRQRQTEIAADLQAVFETRSRDEWMETFASLAACVGPVNDLSEAASDPQVQHRSMIAKIDGARVGPASPLKLGRGAGSLLPAPALGEHTDEVLLETGLTTEEILHLRASGVV